MSKLYNNSGILGCKSPQKSGNSPQTGGKKVLPAPACKNLENPTCSTQLAAPFAAPAPCAAIEKLDNAAVEQSAAGGKFGNGVELGSIERRYVAGDETGSTLSGHSTKTQQILANTHKCFVQKANNNTNAACRTAKKHSKVLRAVACGCLAILMCGTAFLGTACSGSAASMNAGQGSAAGVNYGNGTTGNAGLSAGAGQNFATQGGGLITPRADDPVIFETKNGLEIKFGFDYSTLGSGALAGFPYFNTIDPNGVNYTWVIIGKNPNITNYHSLLLYNHEYNMPDALTFNFVPMPESSIENLTPAGQAIYAHLSKMKYNYPGNNYDLSLTNLISNAEIPANCVLCMLNDPVGQSNNVHASTGIYDLELVTFGSISALGLTEIQSRIQTVNVTYRFGNSEIRTADVRIFSFGYAFNFQYSTYLTQSQVACGAKIPLRDRISNNVMYYIGPDGEYGAESHGQTGAGPYSFRPLFVMSMV